jgi:hypothetical protein
LPSEILLSLSRKVLIITLSVRQGATETDAQAIKSRAEAAVGFMGGREQAAADENG